jgi:hypothetical protein
MLIPRSVASENRFLQRIDVFLVPMRSRWLDSYWQGALLLVATTLGSLEIGPRSVVKEPVPNFLGRQTDKERVMREFG